VPLVATATDSHVLAATIYSKSVLRVVAEEVALALPWACYFPSYEIVTGPQASHDFFEPNRRDVSPNAIEAVMSAFLAACETGGAPAASVAAPPRARVCCLGAGGERRVRGGGHNYLTAPFGSVRTTSWVRRGRRRSVGHAIRLRRAKLL
jgi:hypothetical protein